MSTASQTPTIAPLLTWLTTTDQLNELRVLIDTTVTKLSSATVTTLAVHAWLSSFPSFVVEQWPVLFPSTPANLKLTPAQLSQQLKALQQALSDVPVTQLTLSFVPTTLQFKQYVTMLRAKLDESLFVTVIVDESIIGGCQLTYQGQKFSSTLKDRLEPV